MIRPFVIDFETKPIVSRPGYPPEPVGVAIKRPVEGGWSSRYLSWGHPSGNNCDRAHATSVLRAIWQSGAPVLFHHAKFDLSVAYERLGLPYLEWSRVHDTVFLAFLADPHAPKHDLKGLAHSWLNMPPDERDAIALFVWEHRVELEAMTGQKVKRREGTAGRSGKPGEASNAGEFIWACPASLVGPYAIGDVERTWGLFEKLWPLVAAEMGTQAYDRERELLPILMANERVGMRVDTQALASDIQTYQAQFERVERLLRQRLGAADLNFDADIETAQALIAAGIIRDEDVPRTPKSGQLSMSKENLKPEMFSDSRVYQALRYRNALSTCLRMFMEPWAAQAAVNAGYITTNWNQTRGIGGGTRTGRPSCSNHNFLNISKDFETKKDGYVHPDFIAGLPNLPLVRKYVFADEGQEWLHRDFSGQELRVFAHYESGDLLAAYIADPDLDPHAWVSGEITKATGFTLDRTRTKNVTFARLYGGGLGAIEWQARCKDRNEAKLIADAHDAGLPGRKLLDDRIQRIGRAGLPIFTWGGRAIYPEPADKFGNQKDYKTINYEIQGGAADITKQALIEWNKAKLYKETRFLVTVYDEINVSADLGARATREMALLKEVMNADRLDVPMRSDGKRGPAWGRLEKCE